MLCDIEIGFYPQFAGKSPATEPEPLSIPDLRGLGKELWSGIDAADHVERERRSCVARLLSDKETPVKPTEEYAEAHPEHAEKKREIFEAWAIQKIAGLQLCVEQMSEQFNRHLQGHKMP